MNILRIVHTFYRQMADHFRKKINTQDFLQFKEYLTSSNSNTNISAASSIIEANRDL